MMTAIALYRRWPAHWMGSYRGPWKTREQNTRIGWLGIRGDLGLSGSALGSRHKKTAVAAGWHPVKDRVSLEGTKRVHALPGSTDRHTEVAVRYTCQEPPQPSAATLKRDV